MTRRYYASRKGSGKLDLNGLCSKVRQLYLFLRERDYFRHKAGIDKTRIPDKVKYEATLVLGFQAFPVTDWYKRGGTEDEAFSLIEFLYDQVSAPVGDLVAMTQDGWNYSDYEEYDDQAGREVFRKYANMFLCDYGPGFELSSEGQILALAEGGLEYIVDAEIPRYDDANVDTRVRDAIRKWRNRSLSVAERRQAIRELADVFEWLKKTKKLEQALTRKDETRLFEIANTFAIRHHEPGQKSDYEESIWYPWMFHIYLATYHLAVRLLKRHGDASPR